MYKFSPSSLSLLKECPRCFYLSYKKGIKRPESIFPSLPSGMDLILKQHFDRYMRIQQLPPELQHLKDIQLYNNEEQLKIWRSNLKGIQYTDKAGNICRGAIDNLLVHKGKLIILDYKTRGFPLKEDTAAHYQDQLDIYTFLFRKNGHKTEDYAYLLFYHPKEVAANGDVIFNTDLVRMPVDPKNAERIFTHALKILNGDMPEPSQECGFCAWAHEYKA